MASHQSRIPQRDKSVSDDSGRRERTKHGINVVLLTFMHLYIYLFTFIHVLQQLAV